MGTKMSGRICRYQISKVIAGLVFVFCLSSLVFSNEESARIYLKKASEQAKKKDYQAALESFRKAIEEAPEMPEVYYERGLMYYQAREMTEAINDFNKAAELLKNKPSLTKPLQEIQNKITAYQNEYNKIKEEFTTINQKYIAKFMSLAEKYQDSGDDYLLEILKRLSVMESDNKDIKQRLDKIKEGVFKQEKSVMSPLFNGTDLKGWEGPADVWEVEEEKIVGVISGGAAVLRHTGTLENNYTVSVDIKMEETYREDYMLGLVIGLKNIHNLYECAIFKGRLVLIRVEEAGDTDKST